MPTPRTPTVRAPKAMVCSIDHLASSAGLHMLAAGGSAADAAVAANAVLTITMQHMCGLGGDLFALIHHGDGPPAVLNASGRAGSGASSERIRSAGHTRMPQRGEIGSAPVPGCIDGLLALHERFGRLPLAQVLGPAIRFATDGFGASTGLARASARVADVDGNTDLVHLAAGDLVTRPGAAAILQAVVDGGREAHYQGHFGDELIRTGAGEYTADDLARVNADWVDPVRVHAWGHDIWTTPPNTQGYLSAAGAWIADGLDVPTDSSDPQWAHLLIESARAAAFDRQDALHEGADGNALVSPERLGPRRDRISPTAAAAWGDHYADGGTMYLCTTDADGMGVSLIQSNANGFGSHLVIGDTGVFLHNRGIGFSLVDGHPAEYGPGRRPPHTLSPALVTTPDGQLRSVLGTMGGDAQPQIVLQMLARLLHNGESPGRILSAGRWVLSSPDPESGFDTWTTRGDVRVVLEPHAPTEWVAALEALGHTVHVDHKGTTTMGHAHLIDLAGPTLAGASDPRALSGAALGL